ncbi:sensor histidine kinase, partial [Roseateles sp. P5_E1]
SSLGSVPALAPICAADVGRLHQCLLNLLTNAIKYNRPGGWARIAVTGDSQAVAIAVSDNGFGMDALQRQHLFEPFNRLGRQLGSTPGAGLGLMITRQFVEAMNGQLRVESEPGQGSCFTISLPGAPDPGEDTINHASSNAALRAGDAVSHDVNDGP